MSNAATRLAESLLTTPEVASLIKVSPRTIYRWTQANPSRIPCVRLGRSLRFQPEAVLRWLEARKEG